MAIYRLSFSSNGNTRSAGRSAVAHYDYIEREGKYARGRHGEDLVHAEHGNLPRWARDNPRDFWTAAEAFERANGRLYSEMLLTLPRELSEEASIRLVHSFVLEQLGDKHAYSLAVHNSPALDGRENRHAHVMFSERENDGLERSREQYFKRANTKSSALGGAKKSLEWNDRGKVEKLRLDWQISTNIELERAGRRERVDCRSLAERGEKREPEPKLGPERTSLLRRGIETPESAKVIDLRAYRAAHRELGRVEREIGAVQSSIVDLTSSIEQAVKERDAARTAARRAEADRWIEASRKAPQRAPSAQALAERLERERSAWTPSFAQPARSERARGPIPVTVERQRVGELRARDLARETGRPHRMIGEGEIVHGRAAAVQLIAGERFLAIERPVGTEPQDIERVLVPEGRLRAEIGERLVARRGEHQVSLAPARGRERGLGIETAPELDEEKKDGGRGLEIGLPPFKQRERDWDLER